MNKIQIELLESKKYQIPVLIGTDIVALTLDNVAKIEMMIQNDSRYSKSSNPNVTEKPDGTGGSTAYWAKRFVNALNSNLNINSDEYKKIVFGFVSAVDRENSTHLNGDKAGGIGRKTISEWILSLSKQKIIYSLKFPKETHYELIYFLSRKTAEIGGKQNKSFASKFCHYLCFYYFWGTEYQDNFSIYDDVIKKHIGKYAFYYLNENWSVKKVEKSFYDEYQKLIDRIIFASGNKISRNGFDHLLWYYSKSRN